MPTQPFRKIIDLKKALKLLIKNKSNTIIGVKNLNRSKNNIFKKVRGRIIINKSKTENRQFSENVFTPCGSFYITKFSSFLKSKNIYNKKIISYETHFPYNFDINNTLDLEVANLISTKYKL